MSEIKINDQLESLTSELKSMIEAKGEETNESKAKIEALEAKLIEVESKSAFEEKLSIAKSELEAKLEAMGTEFKAMEKTLYRSTSTGGNKMNTETKDFEQFLRTMDSKYLRTDRDPDGGYLVPRDMHNEIIGKIVEVSDFRRMARVVQITGKSLDVDRRASDLTVGWLGEGVAATASQPAYENILIPANKLMAEVRITNELLGDAAYDMVAELNVRAALKFAEAEGKAFINGVGANQPQGILQAGGVLNVNSGHASQLTAGAFFGMLGLMKYRNPTFVMNRATFADARKLIGSDGQFLLQGGLDGRFDGRLGGTAGMIAGIPVMLMQEMPNVGAGNKAVALIDAQEAYMIVDRLGINVIRDDYTLASEDKVKFVMSRRVGGAVIQPEAIVIMTIGA